MTQRLRVQGLMMVYDLLLCCLACLLPLILILRRRRRGPLPGFRAKCFGTGAHLAQGSILIHGVSLGEVSLMRLLTEGLGQLWHRDCLLTTSTDTGWLALQRQAEHTPRAWLPFDLPWAVDRFLDRSRPAALLLLELELWPRLLLACRRRGIPVFLLNARVGERSFAGYRRLRPFLRPMLQALNLSIAQNPLWAARLRALGCSPVYVSGSLKADLIRIATDTECQALQQRLALEPSQPLLLVASSSEGEEGACVEAWRRACPEWRLVICPRHPERGAALARQLQEQGLSVWRWTDQTAAPDPSAVCIVDVIGQLNGLYALAEIAIVGGSLGSGRHGQNMLEAAAQGCATVVGLDTSNFPDAMALLRSAHAIIESAADELSAALAPLIADPEYRHRLGRAGQAAWASSRGASQRSLAILQQHCPRLPGRSPSTES